MNKSRTFFFFFKRVGLFSSASSVRPLVVAVHTHTRASFEINKSGAYRDGRVMSVRACVRVMAGPRFFFLLRDTTLFHLKRQEVLPSSSFFSTRYNTHTHVMHFTCCSLHSDGRHAIATQYGMDIMYCPQVFLLLSRLLTIIQI